VTAVDLFVESHGHSQRPRVVAWIAGIAAIALLFRFQWQLWFVVPLLFAALILAVGLSGHLGRSERNASFWLFNHRLWLATAFALVGACLFGGGLSIILETLNFLFGLELPSKWHDHIWTIALGFMAPVSWLALALQNFTDKVGEQETEFTTRAVAAIVKFVLVPLLLAYTAVLYVYAIKIALAGTLPKGTLGSLGVGYLLTRGATLLLAYPIRDSGGPARPTVLAQLGLARVAAGAAPVSRGRHPHQRLWPHRAALLDRAHRRLGLALLRILRPERFDLRLVPGVLAILLLVASFGPWGAMGASVLSQTAELAGILRDRGLLVDGKIVVQPAGSEGAFVLGTDAPRVRGIEWYLNMHDALSRLAPWFEGREQNPFAEGKTPEQTSREILAALSLRPDVPQLAGVVYFTHYSDVPEVVSLDGSGKVIGPVVFEGGGPVPVPIPAQSVTVEGLGMVRLKVADNILTANVENGPELRFTSWRRAHKLANLLSKEHRPLRPNAASDGLSGVVLIDNLNGT
jgi:Domain of unknown function (DUF4153)